MSKSFYVRRGCRNPGEDARLVWHHLYSDVSNRDWSQNFRRIVSIDPGIVNLALRVESRTIDGKIQVEVFEKTNLEKIEIPNSDGEETTYFKAISFLDKFRSFFLQSHIIIVERQIMPNYSMVRLQQHFMTYFTFILQESKFYPLLVEIHPRMKNNFFQMPKGSNAKKWIVEKAVEILTQRGDLTSIEMMSNKFKKEKKDDLSVVVVQIEVVWKQLGWN